LNQKYYFRVSLEDYYIRKRNFNFCDLTLIADSKTWIKIFSGKVINRLFTTNERQKRNHKFPGKISICEKSPHHFAQGPGRRNYGP